MVRSGFRGMEVASYKRCKSAEERDAVDSHDETAGLLMVSIPHRIHFTVPQGGDVAYGEAPSASLTVHQM